MIIQLKRFTHKRGSGSYAQVATQEKVTDFVKCPEQALDMRPYVLGLHHAPDPVFYDLYAVSNHFGSLNGGHYTATCKNQPSGKWYSFTDSQCEPAQGEIVTPAAYLLFYRRRD